MTSLLSAILDHPFMSQVFMLSEKKSLFFSNWSERQMKEYQIIIHSKKEQVEQQIIAKSQQFILEKLIFLFTNIKNKKITSLEHLPSKEKEQLSETIVECLESLIPWRKGPYSLLGNSIEAEWDSSFKWERIKPHLGKVKDKIICDIGCNNGFFMFKLQELNPHLIYGLEPTFIYYLQYLLLSLFMESRDILFDLLGIEHLTLFKQQFDIVLCLGILYHHTDPLKILTDIHHSLQKGGKVIIDCQGIAGEESICLFPEKKYAGAKGIWFLPTESCLLNWVKRAGYQKINLFFKEKLSSLEQRKTKLAPYPSLAENLTADQQHTKEGYPAPWRFYLIAEK